MEARIEALKKRRVRALIVCIVYFLVLLAVGGLIFLKDASYGPQMAAFCVALYLLLVRPVLKRYTQQLRKGVLETTIGAELREMTYDAKEGLSLRELEQTGLTPVPLPSHLSRELVTGRSGGFRVKLADVTFPILSRGKNEMFSGCGVLLEHDDRTFATVRVEAGSLVSGDVDGEVGKLLVELDSFIPGCLYINAEENRLSVILRGRFLGYRINPLMDVSERTLSADPLPELKKILELARMLGK